VIITTITPGGPDATLDEGHETITNPCCRSDSYEKTVLISVATSAPLVSEDAAYEHHALVSGTGGRGLDIGN